MVAMATRAPAAAVTYDIIPAACVIFIALQKRLRRLHPVGISTEANAAS